MAHLLITRHRSYARHGQLTRVLSELRLGKITTSLAVIIMTVMVSFSYLTVSNKQITQGYKINELDVKKAHLIEAKEQISRQVDEATAIKTIETAAYKQGMQSNSLFTYIDAEAEVAKR